MTVPTSSTEDLLLAWRRHVADEDELFARLVTRHRERQRRYHRLEHVAAVVDHVVHLAQHEGPSDVSAVVAAAFYHDAIYEPTHHANERASARLARRDLERLGWESDRAAAVALMIEGTATHVEPVDVDTAVLFDADLAILGSDDNTYRRYVDEVRAEYRHLDDETWVAGRSAFVDGALARNDLYATPTGRRRWAESARANLTAERDRLRDAQTSMRR